MLDGRAGGSPEEKPCSSHHKRTLAGRARFGLARLRLNEAQFLKGANDGIIPRERKQTSG